MFELSGDWYSPDVPYVSPELWPPLGGARVMLWNFRPLPFEHPLSVSEFLKSSNRKKAIV
jgi:hypothetical protein